jgi:RimJ/RimL family protein N-acetyltransferase
LDADIQPGNRRSREFAARLGFRRGGEQSVLLKIGSRWRAHERWTMSRDAWRSGRQELVARA